MKKEKVDMRVNQSRREELRRDCSRQACATAMAGEGYGPDKVRMEHGCTETTTFLQQH